MSEREWRFYLDDMIGFAEKVLAYTQGFDHFLPAYKTSKACVSATAIFYFGLVAEPQHRRVSRYMGRNI